MDAENVGWEEAAIKLYREAFSELLNHNRRESISDEVEFFLEELKEALLD
jgi:hypothetical protein